MISMLSTMVDNFKMKNPAIFLIVAGTLYVVNMYMVSFISEGELNGNVKILIEVSSNIITGFLTLLGAHTPESFKVGKTLYKKQ